MPPADCLSIPPTPTPQAITLPGGITLEQLDLMAAIQPALTPLMPMFQLVDAVVAAFKVIKAIPDALGPPPDPSAIASALPDLSRKVMKLLRLVPQLSLPLTVVGTVDVVLDALRQARGQLVQLQRRTAKVAAATERAAELGDAGLAAIARCAGDNIVQEADNVGLTLASHSKLIGILNVFLGLIGVPIVADLSGLAGHPLEDTIVAIDAAIEVFGALRRAVPLP